MDIDGPQLLRHAFVEHSTYEVVILLGKRTLTVIMLFSQVETDDVAAILSVKTCKVLLGGRAALILHFVNDDVRLWSDCTWRL